MNPLWLSGGATAVNSAAGLLGMFGSRGPSERDLMWEQLKVNRSAMHAASQIGMRDWGRQWTRQMREGPSRTMAGLRRAGLNPMLAVSSVGGNSAASMQRPSTPSASVATPVNRMEPLMRGIQAGVASAMEVARTMAEIDKTKAETETEKRRPELLDKQSFKEWTLGRLYEQQRTTEAYKADLMDQQRLYQNAETARSKQLLKLNMVETAIKKEELTAAERDAVLAVIDTELYSSSIGELARELERLGLNYNAARGLAGGLLRVLGIGNRSK